MLATMLASAVASAHAPAEAIDLVWTASGEADAALDGPDLVVTNRGLVFIGDEGGAQLRCGEAFDATTQDRPRVLPTGDGQVLIGIHHGVYLTEDRACTLEPASGLPDISLGSPVAVDLGLVIATRSATERAGLLGSEDQGATWLPRHELERGSYFRNVIATDAAPGRLYAQGFAGAGGLASAFCGVSRDAGETWERFPLELGVDLWRADQSDPAVVYGRVELQLPAIGYQLLRSEDGCQRFEPILDLPGEPRALIDFAGSTWLGVDDGGLYRSTDGGRSFTRQLDTELVSVNCLAARGDVLFACGTTASGVRGVFRLGAEDEPPEPFLLMTDVQRPVPCATAPQRAACAAAWYDYYSETQQELAQRDALASGPPGLEAGPEGKQQLPLAQGLSNPTTPATLPSEPGSASATNPEHGTELPTDSAIGPGQNIGPSNAAETSDRVPSSHAPGAAGCSVRGRRASSSGAWLGMLLAGALGWRRPRTCRRRASRLHPVSTSEALTAGATTAATPGQLQAKPQADSSAALEMRAASIESVAPSHPDAEA